MLGIIPYRFYFIFVLFSCWAGFSCPLYAIPKDIDFSPLAQLVGQPLLLPLLGPDSVNVHGDAVGRATFGSAKDYITAIWYWDKETGFQILATSKTVPGIRQPYFYVFEPKINNNKVVACQYYTLHKYNINTTDGHCGNMGPNEVYGYFWWSKKEGIHFFPWDNDYPFPPWRLIFRDCGAVALMSSIDDKDQILFKYFNGCKVIVDIHSQTLKFG